MRNIGHMDAWEKFRVVDTGDGQVLWRRVGGSGPGKGREIVEIFGGNWKIIVF